MHSVTAVTNTSRSNMESPGRKHKVNVELTGSALLLRQRTGHTAVPQLCQSTPAHGFEGASIGRHGTPLNGRSRPGPPPPPRRPPTITLPLAPTDKSPRSATPLAAPVAPSFPIGRARRLLLPHWPPERSHRPASPPHPHPAPQPGSRLPARPARRCPSPCSRRGARRCSPARTSGTASPSLHWSICSAGPP